MKQIKELLHQMGEPGEALLARYFQGGGAETETEEVGGREQGAIKY